MSGGHAGGDRLSALLAFDLEIDTRGLLKKALQTLEGGQVVRVLATDPASVLDFGVFVEQTGHALLDWREETGVFIYLIRKG